jgi:hypothetical protein
VPNTKVNSSFFLLDFHKHVGADGFSVIAYRRLLLELRSFSDAQDEAGNHEKEYM